MEASNSYRRSAGLLAAALCLVAGALALPSAAAAAPTCGSAIPKPSPKQSPTSTPSSKKKKKQASKHRKQARKHRKQASKHRKQAHKRRSAKKKKKRKRKAAKSAEASNWVCSFSDDFNGTTVDPSKWVAQRTDTSGYTSGKTACFVDSPGNISVAGGALRLTARREASPFTCDDPTGVFDTQYTSGMVSTAAGRFSQAYGRYEIRARVSSARVGGLQTSFWLWPLDAGKYGSWPGSGEIDIAELYSQYADRAIPYVHYLQPDPNVTNNNCVIGNPEDFHTYALEWTPSTMKVIYDGKPCLTDTLAAGNPFDQPFIVVLTQALGIGTNRFNPATTPLPATTVVDYVRVWR